MIEETNNKDEYSVDNYINIFNLTDKKSIYFKYLIKKIGFSDSEFSKNYLIELNKNIFKFKFIDSIPLETPNIESDDDYFVIGNKYYTIKNDIFVPIKFDIIDYLTKEYSIKKDKSLKYRKKSNPKIISATDLANFIYCPVSFSINKTFITSKIEATHNGVFLHEQARILNYYKNIGEEKFDYDSSNVIDDSFIDNLNKLFVEDVRKSTLIFSGHNLQDKSKYFISNKGTYAGQPDYIFKNQKNDFFVVEEKYQLNNNNDNSSDHFYNNHIMQLISYLHAIPNYDLKYGYLVYWKYNNDYGNLKVSSLKVKKIEKTESSKMYLIKEFNNLKSFINSGELAFETNSLNHKKCANCVLNLYCGHKTAKFDKITYPYSESYLKTYYVQFPDDLKLIYKEPKSVEIFNSEYNIDIDELDLSNMDLKAIPKNVKFLKNLKKLNLSMNQLIDISIVRNLTNLKILNLEFNKGNKITSEKISNLQNELPDCVIIW